MIDKDSLLVQILNEFPIIRRVGEDMLIDCEWDLDRARKNLQTLFHPQPEIQSQNTFQNKANKEIHYISDDSEEINSDLNDKVNIDKKILDLISRAKQRKRWLLIVIFEKDQPGDWLLDSYFTELLNSRFEHFTTSSERPESACLKITYDIYNFPAFLIIDPFDIFKPNKGKITGTKEEFAETLNEFLFLNPKYGPPLSQYVRKTFQKQNEENEQIKYEEDSDNVIDLGHIVPIKIQSFDKKATTVEIGENQTILSLYKEVSANLGIDPNTFELQVSYPQKTLNNMKSTIKNEQLNNAFLRIIQK